MRLAVHVAMVLCMAHRLVSRSKGARQAREALRSARDGEGCMGKHDMHAAQSGKWIQQHALLHLP